MTNAHGAPSHRSCEPSGTFPKAARIRKRAEFQAVQEHGERVNTPHFVVLLHGRSDDSSADPRLGITASRRVGNAVRRNRAKRLVREAFRATRALWARGIDVVIIVRALEVDLKLQSVVAELVAARAKISARAVRALDAAAKS